MEKIAPSGPVYQAGTLSGNPLAMAAGYAALTYIKNHPELYKTLEEKSSYLEKGMRDALKNIKKEYALNRIGSMMTLFFTEGEVNNFKSAVKSDTALYGRFFSEILKRGIYLAPAQFEAAFVSTAHSKADINKTIKACSEALRSVSL